MLEWGFLIPGGDVSNRSLFLILPLKRTEREGRWSLGKERGGFKDRFVTNGGEMGPSGHYPRDEYRGSRLRRDGVGVRVQDRELKMVEGWSCKVRLCGPGCPLNLSKGSVSLNLEGMAP